MKKIILISLLRAIAICGQIAFIKVYTHYLSAAQLGHYYFYFTASYFLNALIFVPVDFFQQAEVFKLQKRKLSLHNLIHLNKLLLPIVALISLIVGIILIYFKLVDITVYFSIVLTSLCTFIATSTKNFINNQGGQVLVVSTMILEFVTKTVSFLIFIIFFGFKRPETVLCATIISLLIGLIPLYPRARSIMATFGDQKEIINKQRLLNFCWPLSFGAILNWLQLQGYRLILVPLGYAEMVGIFATVSSVGSTGMNAAATIYQQIYLPRIYQSHGEYTRKYLKYAMFVIVIIFLIGMLFKNLIISLITSKIFLQYSSVIGLGILIESGNFIIGAISVHMSINEQMVDQIKATFYGVLFVPIIFLILVYSKMLNTYTIGFPLFISQIIICVYLFKRSGFGHAR